MGKMLWRYASSIVRECYLHLLVKLLYFQSYFCSLTVNKDILHKVIQNTGVSMDIYG